jgi:hypothetical protein
MFSCQAASPTHKQNAVLQPYDATAYHFACQRRLSSQRLHRPRARWGLSVVPQSTQRSKRGDQRFTRSRFAGSLTDLWEMPPCGTLAEHPGEAAPIERVVARRQAEESRQQVSVRLHQSTGILRARRTPTASGL